MKENEPKDEKGLPDGFEEWVKKQDNEFVMFCSPQHGLLRIETGMKPFYAYMLFEKYIVETEDGTCFFNAKKYLMENMVQRPDNPSPIDNL